MVRIAPQDVPDRAQGVEARQARHGHVEQQQIGLRGLHRLDGLLAGARLADDLEAGADVDAVHVHDDRRRHRQQLPEARPEHALVVGDHDAYDAVGPSRQPWNFRWSRSVVHVVLDGRPEANGTPERFAVGNVAAP